MSVNSRDSRAMILLKNCLILLAAFALSTVEAKATSAWVTLNDCTFLWKQANDADSFHVQCAGKEYIFRLYYVDAPETDTRFRGRVKKQAKYFKGTMDDALKLGDLAKHFTQEKLSKPFVVRTCWQDARGKSRLPRYFAFIQAADGDLAEMLIENGLARVHGAPAEPAGMPSAKAQWQKLRTLENKAKQERVGAWGVKEGRAAKRTDNPTSGRGGSSFEAFFHSNPPATTNLAAAPSATPPVIVSPSQCATQIAPDQEKLDINTATLAELEKLPGVGPSMAKAIIAARPFKSGDDLRRVKGIGDAKYEKLRPLFR